MAGRVLTETAAPPSRIDWPAALKESGLAAFVALVLFLPLVGMQTIKIEGGVGLHFRLDWVLIGVALVAVGRVLLIGLRTVRPGTIAAVAAPITRIPALLGPYAHFLVAAGLVFAFVLPFLPFANRYVVDIATTVLIYVMLGWGLNIVVGLAGLLDLGYVAFYAVGAYSFALFARWFDLGFWECLPLAGVLAASFGILLGFPVLRLRGDYLAIVTLGFGEIIRIILLNWYPVTKGPVGLSDIPRPTFFGMEFSRKAPEGTTAFHEYFGLDFSGFHRVAFLYFLILILALITNAFVLRIRKLPIGRAWEALREDEIACRALGINPTNTKLTAFALGAMFGGFGGSFFATRQGFISPESFTFIEFRDDPCDRRARRHGQPDRRGVRCDGPDPAAGVRPRVRAVPDAPVRGRHGHDHGVAAARPVRPPRADHPAAWQGRDRRRRAGATMNGGAPLLEVERLTMRFGGLVAIDDLSFTAHQRQITAIIGPNGAGKTTVFNCLTGFYKPTVGQITFHADGQQLLLEQMDGFRIARAGVARTFQNIRLFGQMSVLENLVVAQHNALMRASGYTVLGVLGFASYRHAEEAAVERARDWLNRINLIERADWDAANLPYGDQRRLEIARAMCTQPKLLCLDEPAAGLNPRETGDLRQLLMRIRDEFGIGVLLIEHDMSVVMGISDHIVVLDYGRKIADGAPEQIKRDPNVIKAYLGETEEEALPPEVAADLAAERGSADARSRRRSRPLRPYRSAARGQHPGRSRRDRHHHRRQRRGQVDPVDDHLRPAQGERRRRSSSTASVSMASSPTTSSAGASPRRPRAGASSRR